jgi:hypothetical protein
VLLSLTKVTAQQALLSPTKVTAQQALLSLTKVTAQQALLSPTKVTAQQALLSPTKVRWMVVVVMETAAAATVVVVVAVVVVVQVMMQKLRHRVVGEIGGVSNLLFGHQTQRLQRPHHKVDERSDEHASAHFSSTPHGRHEQYKPITIAQALATVYDLEKI